MSILIQDRIMRYKSWLKREQVERPLVGLIWEPDIPTHPDLIDLSNNNQEITPDQIKPVSVLPLIEKWYQRDAELHSDVIQCFCPAFGIPWMEAIAGCKIVSHPGTLWAEPFLSSYHDRAPIKFNSDNPWLCKLLEFTDTLINFSNGRFPVALPQMRGPLDIVAAIRSQEMMCIDMLEQPEEVSKILNELTELWIDVNEYVLNQIPSFFGGYMSRMKAWMPGKTITPQNDVSSLISPRLYRELIAAYDHRIVSSFPYHCYHLHAAGYNHFHTILNLDQLTAMQVTLEHTLGGPSLESIMPVLYDILKKKPLFLCALDTETADLCIRELPSEGLAVTIGLQGDDFDRGFDEWVERYCR